MAYRSSPIPNETKQNIRRDFVLGKGSTRVLSQRYGTSGRAISEWIDAEKWTELRDLFAREDELIEVKLQLMQLNQALRRTKAAKRFETLWKAKSLALEAFFTLAGLPRRPIGKLEKPKTNTLLERIERAAKEEAEEREEIKASEQLVAPAIEVQSESSAQISNNPN